MWPSKKIIGVVPYNTALNGFRVKLRPPRSEDEAEWIGLRSKNKRFLLPYEPRWARDALTPTFFERRLHRVRNDWESDRAYSFLIFRRNDHDAPSYDRPAGETMIGGININHVCRGAAQSGSLGYWIDQEHQGRGYMRAAMRLVIHFAHDELKLHRLNAATLTYNTSSQNLLGKMGFQQEGRAREYVEINNVWEDHILFGLILREYMQEMEQG